MCGVDSLFVITNFRCSLHLSLASLSKSLQSLFQELGKQTKIKNKALCSTHTQPERTTRRRVEVFVVISLVVITITQDFDTDK